MESNAGSKFLFFVRLYRKTASHFSGRTLSARDAASGPAGSMAGGEELDRHFLHPLGAARQGVGFGEVEHARWRVDKGPSSKYRARDVAMWRERWRMARIPAHANVRTW